jgi:hypothetical protein
MGRKRKNLQKNVCSIPPGITKALAGRGGLEPPDPVVAVGLLPIAFGSSVMSGAFLASPCTVLGPPPLAPSDHVITMASLATFTSVACLVTVAYSIAFASVA